MLYYHLGCYHGLWRRTITVAQLLCNNVLISNWCSAPIWFWAWALSVIQFEHPLGGFTVSSILVKLVEDFPWSIFFLAALTLCCPFSDGGYESLQQSQGDFDIMNQDRSLQGHCSWTQCWSFGNPVQELLWEDKKASIHCRPRGKDLNFATKLFFVTIYIQLQATAFLDRHLTSLRSMTSLPSLS